MTFMAAELQDDVTVTGSLSSWHHMESYILHSGAQSDLLCFNLNANRKTRCLIIETKIRCFSLFRERRKLKHKTTAVMRFCCFSLTVHPGFINVLFNIFFTH